MITALLALPLLGLCLVAIRIDQYWLRLTPLTPLSVAVWGAFVRGGAGGALSTVHKVAYTGKDYVMTTYMGEAQLLWIVFLVGLLVPAWIHDRGIIHREKRRVGLTIDETTLFRFVVVCGLFSLAWMWLGLTTGAASRDPELYFTWVAKFYKPDALFIAFGRLKDIFYFLAPLAIVRSRGFGRKAIIIGLICGVLYFALNLGGRGIVLIPILEMYFGVYLLKPGKNIICFLTLAMLIIGLSGATLLKGNHGLGNTKYAGTMRFQTDIISREALARTGRTLYGCSDAYNFTPNNLNKTGAGFARAERWMTAWLPSYLRGTSKYSARDAHIIAEELESNTPREIAESMAYENFNCVSFGGDLFWRWRWPGVFVGSLIFGCFYALITRLWRAFARLDSYSGCLVFAFPASFLSLYPAGSIGETVWLWSWDIVKYIGLVLILRLVERWSKAGKESNQTGST